MPREGKAKVLTQEELRRVIKMHGGKFLELRNVALISLSYYCGFRAKELASLILGDVLTSQRDLKEEVNLKRHQTKGGKKRVAYLVNKKLRQALLTYLKTRPVDALERPLFKSQKGGLSRPTPYNGYWPCYIKKRVLKVPAVIPVAAPLPLIY